MNEQVNLKWEEVIQISENFPIEPLFNKVIITLNREEPDGNLVLSDNTVSEEQFIIAKGTYVNNLNINDKVILDLEKMMVKRTNPNDIYEEVGSIKFDPIAVDGIYYAILEDRFIKAKYKINQPLQTNE